MEHTDSTHYYTGYERLVQNNSNVNPTFKCSNSNDLYTVSGSSKENKKLTNPIGLITADEVVMAGGSWNSENSSYYLYNNKYYWTMSPYYFDPSYPYPRSHVFLVYSSGLLNDYIVDSTRGVRPVINLSRDVVIKSGNGTSSTPYEI